MAEAIASGGRRRQVAAPESRRHRLRPASAGRGPSADSRRRDAFRSSAVLLGHSDADVAVPRGHRRHPWRRGRRRYRPAFSGFRPAVERRIEHRPAAAGRRDRRRARASTCRTSTPSVIAERPKLGPFIEAMRANRGRRARGRRRPGERQGQDQRRRRRDRPRRGDCRPRGRALRRIERRVQIDDSSMRVRFAPSPTGHLHVGNARTALFNWLLARGGGGSFILRIEDTDLERSTLGVRGRHRGRPALARARLGRRPGHRRTARSVPAVGAAASLRVVRERAVARRTCVLLLLLARPARGGAARGRWQPDSRRATRATAARSLASEAEARIAAGERPAMRFRVPEDREIVFTDAVRGEVRFHTDVIGDPVIVRADGMPAYNFAVVVDDALMGITHVIRGEDHISNTPRQTAALRGARILAAGVRSSCAGAGPGSQPALEAARRDLGRRVPGEGLSA